MSNVKATDKISPSLESFLFDEGPSHDGPRFARDVIVVLRNPKASDDVVVPPHDDRDRFLNELPSEMEPLRAKVSEKYREVWERRVTAQTTEHVTTVIPAGAGCLPVGKVSVTQKTLMDLAGIEEVVAILPNQRLDNIRPHDTIYASPNNRERADGMTWGIKELEVDKLWAQGLTGKGTVVGVLDTGVYESHPAIQGKIDQFVIIDAPGTILRMEGKNTFDADRHGTHVCGTICGGNSDTGIAIGVAYDARLVVAAVLVGKTTLWTLINGIDWAVQSGARILNFSLGLKMFEPRFSKICEILVQQHNVIPIAAIGNDGHGHTSSPANAPDALAVGALDKGSGRLAVSHYSSGASLVFHMAGKERERTFITKPDVVAPGSRIFSCVPPEERVEGSYDYAYMDGTSMGAPHVSGVAALLLEAAPEASAKEIIQALKSTADYQGYGKRPDNRWGKGMVRPLKALRKLTNRPRQP